MQRRLLRIYLIRCWLRFFPYAVIWMSIWLVAVSIIFSAFG